MLQLLYIGTDHPYLPNTTAAGLPKTGNPIESIPAIGGVAEASLSTTDCCFDEIGTKENNPKEGKITGSGVL